MNLAESKLAETIKVLQKLSGDLEQGDKRRARRMSLRIAMQIRPYADGSHERTLQAEMQDISARGLCIRVKQPIHEGSSFLVQLPVENHNQPIAPLICQVVHCQDQGDHSFLVGAEFVGQLDSQPKDTGELLNEEERIRNSILS